MEDITISYLHFFIWSQLQISREVDTYSTKRSSEKGFFWPGIKINSETWRFKI